MEAFIRAIPSIEVIVSINPAFTQLWDTVRAEFLKERKIKTVAGGKQRYHSVKNALLQIANDGEVLVAIHDSVRPALSSELILRCFNHAHTNGSAIPVIPLRDSIRKKKDGKTVIQNRADFVSVQTPQVFQLSQLLEAYQQDFKESFTDDASVYESAGKVVSTVAGESTNIKVTYKEDIKVVDVFLSNQSES